MEGTKEECPETVGGVPGEELPEAAADAPRESDKDYERSLGWYAALVAITTGFFCALLSVGLTLLPATTLTEKSLIIGSCITLAAAGFTGVGAWQSARRFAATAVAVGLAIVGLAALSIAADAGASLHHPAGASSVASPVGQPSRASTGSSMPTAQPPVSGPGTHGKADYVSGNIDGTPGVGDPGPDDGTYYLDGTKYVRSLGYPKLCSWDASGPVTVTYPLSNTYRYLSAELGIAQAYGRDGHNEQVIFKVDKRTVSGLRKEIKQVVLTYGHKVRIRVPIQGAQQIILSTAGSDCIPASVPIWGSVRLDPS